MDLDNLKTRIISLIGYKLIEINLSTFNQERLIELIDNTITDNEILINREIFRITNGELGTVQEYITKYRDLDYAPSSPIYLQLILESQLLYKILLELKGSMN